MTIKAIRFYSKHPEVLLVELSQRKLLDWVPDKRYLMWQYERKLGRPLNLRNPKTFTEKIQWLKLYDRNPLNTVITDKLAVRKYISEKIETSYLVPLLGVWNSFDEIPFNDLPEQFILKCTHDCGGNYVCLDKSRLDINLARDKIQRHLTLNYYRGYREWAYKNIQPRIIAEKYLVDESGNELKDYKFMCFNGDPKYVVVCQNRKCKGYPNVDLFNMKWETLLGIAYRNYKPSGCAQRAPKFLDQMVDLCKALSKPFPFVRVDFYIVWDKIYIGELTLYPEAGYAAFQSNEMDETVGAWLELPDVESVKKLQSV